jgi:hypothetical protein
VQEAEAKVRKKKPEGKAGCLFQIVLPVRSHNPFSEIMKTQCRFVFFSINETLPKLWLFQNSDVSKPCVKIRPLLSWILSLSQKMAAWPCFLHSLPYLPHLRKPDL